MYVIMVEEERLLWGDVESSCLNRSVMTSAKTLKRR